MDRPAAAWRVETQPIAVTNWNFTTVRLTGDKSIAGIVVTSVEASKELGPEFTRQISNDAASEINYAESSALLDVSNDGTGTAPASITSSGIIVESTGADAASLRADLNTLLSQYRGDLSRAVWAVSSATAVRLALAGDSLGDADVNMTGGFFAGLPLCSANGVPDNQVSLIDASGTVLFDGGVSIDVSRNALLKNGETEILNLYQGNYLGYKFVRVLDWETGRPDSVASLVGIPWTATPAP
ncbi:hypothetical protein [Caballeronia novacaledonica]|nr:hypothetical protein [Caballeronia novacaledonica]